MLGGEEKQSIAVDNNPANNVFAGQDSNVTATTVAESNRVFSTPSAKKTADASASFASPSLASPPSAVGGGNAASNILEWSATKLSSLVKNMVNSPSGNSNHIEGGAAASPVLVDRKLQSLSLVDPSSSSTMPMTTCSSASDIINISVALAEGVKSPEASNSQQEIYYSTPSSPANQMKKTSETNFLTSPLQHVSSNININKNSSSINGNFLSSTKQQLMDEFDPLREKSGPNQSVCLLDLSNEFLAASAATPRSQIKYSEKDLNDLLQKDKERQEKEMEFLQLEICNLQQKYENSLAKKNEIEKVLENYQETMNKMIQAGKQKDEERKKADDARALEKQSLEAELLSVQMSFKELHSRYEDLKIVQETYRRNEETLKDAIKTLQKDVLSSESKYETLKKHAELKIEEANKEISKVRASYEAKLLKSDIASKALEETVSAKTKENEELMKICESLIQKME